MRCGVGHPSAARLVEGCVATGKLAKPLVGQRSTKIVHDQGLLHAVLPCGAAVVTSDPDLRGGADPPPPPADRLAPAGPPPPPAGAAVGGGFAHGGTLAGGGGPGP